MKEPSVIEQKAYRDTWGKGLDSYLKWFYDTVVLLRELLADDGSIYVHLDHHVSHYAKTILDEVLGIDSFANEIVWRRSDAHNDKSLKNYGNVHDVILFYRKSTKYTWNRLTTEIDEKTIGRDYKLEQASGRRYRLGDLFGPGGRGVTYEINGITAAWKWSKDKFQEADKAGRIQYTNTGRPFYKIYLDEHEGVPLQGMWTDCPQIKGGLENVTYPTQKPEALLERIINASSNPGDLVLDCFCGSGTTAAVAEKLGRRWITCDLGRFAIHTARKRFLAIDNVKPFVVQNLGKYERQAWQTAEFGENAEALTHAYRNFILSLYRAQPITGYVWLHGVRHGHMVHVGGVDAPISVGDVAQIAAEFKRMTGTGKDAPTQSSVDVLGWDFAFEINEVAKQQAALAGIDVRFVRIPREVLEKKAVEQGDIKFFELAALSVEVDVKARSVLLKMTDFVIPLDDVPQDVQKAITHWEQWIDYWAVDWDNKGDTFHNQWQSYRTRKDKTLQKQIVSPPGTYPAPGEYKVVVKVIDILGNDTTKTLKVQVN